MINIVIFAFALDLVSGQPQKEPLCTRIGERRRRKGGGRNRPGNFLKVKEERGFLTKGVGWRPAECRPALLQQYCAPFQRCPCRSDFVHTSLLLLCLFHLEGQFREREERGQRREEEEEELAFKVSPSDDRETFAALEGGGGGRVRPSVRVLYISRIPCLLLPLFLSRIQKGQLSPKALLRRRYFRGISLSTGDSPPLAPPPARGSFPRI